jgi:hypothetical protein
VGCVVWCGQVWLHVLKWAGWVWRYDLVAQGGDWVGCSCRRVATGHCAGNGRGSGSGSRLDLFAPALCALPLTCLLLPAVGRGDDQHAPQNLLPAPRRRHPPGLCAAARDLEPKGGWVAGRLGSTQLASGECPYPRQLGGLAWGACTCVLITARAAAAVVAPWVRSFLPVSLSVRQPQAAARLLDLPINPAAGGGPARRLCVARGSRQAMRGPGHCVRTTTRTHPLSL